MEKSNRAFQTVKYQRTNDGFRVRVGSSSKKSKKNDQKMWRTASPVSLAHDESASLLPKNLSAGSSYYAYCRHDSAVIVHIESGIVSMLPSNGDTPPDQMTQVIITEMDEKQVAITLSTSGIEFWKLPAENASTPILLASQSIDKIMKFDEECDYPYLKGVAVMEASDSPSGNYLAIVGCSSGDVVVLENIDESGMTPRVFRKFISEEENVGITDVVITDFRSLIAVANENGYIRLYNIRADAIDEVYCSFEPPSLSSLDIMPDKYTPEPVPSCPCHCLAARGTTLIAGYINGSIR
jgi:hypothetical protein